MAPLNAIKVSVNSPEKTSLSPAEGFEFYSKAAPCPILFD